MPGVLFSAEGAFYSEKRVRLILFAEQEERKKPTGLTRPIFKRSIVHRKFIMQET